MSHLYELRKNHARFILYGVIAGLVFFAWWNRFIQDDAFISFRYAENLARGAGLVWNAGERVEGYTNFLWTMLMGVVIFLGGDPATWSAVFGLAGFACSLVLTFRISLYIFQSDDISLIAVILLGTNYTFAAYATGGLETSLQAMLYLATVYFVVKPLVTKRCRTRDAVKISLLLTACMLLRLDSALLCIVVFAFITVLVVRQARPSREKIATLAALMAPFVLTIACWFFWKLGYYGDLLPNTYYVKVTSVQSMTRGIFYLHRFLSSYLLYPVALLSIFSMRRFFGRLRTELLLLLLIALAWLAYVLKVGGDFMEFRFLVPVIPMLVLLFMWLMFEFTTSNVVRAGCIFLVLIGSMYHVLTFTYDADDGIESIAQLRGHLTDPAQQWGNIGKVLGKAFNDDPRVLIATTAAGAIPYYSRLSTIDMLGLNDKFIARYGYYFGRAAGHERMATLAYLQQRKVNIIVSHPYVTLLSDEMIKVPLIPGAVMSSLPESKAVEIPLDGVYKLIVLYLNPTPFVDSVITAQGWKVHQIIKG